MHPTEYLERSNRVWSARPGWRDDPELASAGFVLGARGLALTEALAVDPRFRLAESQRASWRRSLARRRPWPCSRTAPPCASAA